jgi:hypothetical protein
MHPRLPTCENTLKWVIEQAIPSLKHSFVTRRFLVFRGTTAGPSVDVRHTRKGPAGSELWEIRERGQHPGDHRRLAATPRFETWATALAIPELGDPQQISLPRRSGTVA